MVSKSYFTNIVVQNVNIIIYIMDCNLSLKMVYSTGTALV